MDKTNKRALKLVAVLVAVAVGITLAFPAQAHAYEQRETIVNSGHGSLSPSYLVIHETANPGASAYNHYLLYSRGYKYAVHYVMELDGSVVYHTMADNRKSWSVGNGNSRVVSIELAHATNQADFNKQWREAVKWAGDYLNKRGWGINRMISHNDARLKWGGTDHTDPIGYFNKYGKSWAQFKAEVQAYMHSGQVGGTIVDGTTDKPTAPASNYSGTNKASFGGTYTVMVDKLNVRSAPSTNSQAVASYHKGATVKLDGWYKINDGYVWGKYTARSGKTRYVAVGKPTGGVSASDYLVKGGTVSNQSTSGAGTYRFKTTVNIRSGAGTGYAVVGKYQAGSTVHSIKRTIVKDGYVWGEYTAYSGKTRYVALGVSGGKSYATKIA